MDIIPPKRRYTIYGGIRLSIDAGREYYLFGHPARSHSRMRVQLMASARHAIDSRDASLLPSPMGMYVRTIT